MAWIIGIDEAGYGPNLGPFVMSSVACQVPADLAGANLWHALGRAVRRGEDRADGRLLVDDSKVVYSSARGLAGLERGVLSILNGSTSDCGDLKTILKRLCPQGTGELCAEVWFSGVTALPGHAAREELAQHADRIASACAEVSVARWEARTVVVCPQRFNALLDAHGSKGAVLAEGLAQLLRQGQALAGAEDAAFFVDKHGGRNTYAAQLQDALDEGVVVAGEEGMARSTYYVVGLGRAVRFTFQPRADREHFCVALASMVSKYVRELLMGEFNAFWQKHVPGLKSTAGYPGDAARFLEAIRPAAQRLGLAEEAIWRRR
jgi:ribonuclease HII